MVPVAGEIQFATCRLCFLTEKQVNSAHSGPYADSLAIFPLTSANLISSFLVVRRLGNKF